MVNRSTCLDTNPTSDAHPPKGAAFLHDLGKILIALYRPGSVERMSELQSDNPDALNTELQNAHEFGDTTG